jgi:hypothetical protein
MLSLCGFRKSQNSAGVKRLCHYAEIPSARVQVKFHLLSAGVCCVNQIDVRKNIVRVMKCTRQISRQGRNALSRTASNNVEVGAVTKTSKCTQVYESILDTGRAMAQAVSRRPVTAEDRVRSWVSPCGICGRQSGTGTRFSPSVSVFPCQFHSTGAPLLGKGQKIIIIFITGLHNKPHGCSASVASAAGPFTAKKNITDAVYLLHVSVTHVSILREVHYEE